MNYSLNKRTLCSIIILCVAVLGLAAFSTARTPTTPATSVNIVNDSSRVIRNVYLSHVGADDWGTNQLSNGSIAPGQTYSLANVACDQQQVKIIGEDQDGCFVSTVINCGDDATWTITNNTARDCGQ